jgi:hypothetical protein
LFAQVDTNFHFGDLVQAYYSKESKKTLYIYDSKDGNSMDTLDTIYDTDTYSNTAILESE